MHGTIASDPAGKLALGYDAYRLAQMVDEGYLAVYSPCREGSGSTLENLGKAGSGTLHDNYEWRTREDGRHYLHGGYAAFTYHDSMAIADSQGRKYYQSGGLIFRLDTVAEQNLMRRDNWFTLRIDSAGKPALDFYSGSGWKTITGKEALEPGKWYHLSFVIAGNGMAILLDGNEVARLTGFNPRTSPTSDLFVGCYGDWTDFYLIGSSQDGYSILNQATSGTWEKKIHLGADQTVRFIEATVAKKEYEHSASISIAFADNEDDLDYSPNWMWTLTDGQQLLFPQERGLIHGTWMKITVRLGAMSWDRTVPLVDSLRVVTRDVSPVIDSLSEDDGLGYSELAEEEGTPEDLSSALAEIRKLKEFVKEIKRATHHFGGLNKWANTTWDNYKNIRELYKYTLGSEDKDAMYLGNPVALGIFAHQRIDALEKNLGDAVSRLEAELDYHAQQTAGVHGAPSGGAVAWTDQPDQAQGGFTGEKHAPYTGRTSPRGV